VGGKRLALFLDGTWNSIDDNTNVWRLRSLLAEQDDEGVEQRAFYSSGVGTARGEYLRGGALGYGTSKYVRAAYRWLVEQYDEGDEIFVFGFSRGAYMARSLTGLIATSGLLKPGAPLSVEQLYERYTSKCEPIYKLDFRKRAGEAISHDDQRLLNYSRRVPIRMIGVWDTVGALGVPFGRIRGFSRQALRFHNPNLSKIFQNAFHAVAVDEHRAAFKPTLWTRFRLKDKPYDPPSPGQVVEQRWFVGAHSNVGGGIANDEMAQLPLAWLKQKAQDLGLAFRYDVPVAGEEHRGPINDSFSEFMFGVYRFLKFFRRFHRTIGADERDVVRGRSRAVNETIDGSVFDRWQADPTYRPPGLQEWAKRKGIDPGAAAGARDAETGAAI
jgi:uncharacterized protein (DUF2235 family)